MGKNSENPFQASRLRATHQNQNLKSVVWVSMQLHISTDMLYEIESGRRKAAPDVVMGMARLYDDPYLVLEAHQKYHPEYHAFFEEIFGIKVKRKVLEQSALGYISEHHDLNNELVYELMDISKDGFVDERERYKLERIQNETKEFVGEALNLILASTNFSSKTALTEAACR